MTELEAIEMTMVTTYTKTRGGKGEAFKNIQILADQSKAAGYITVDVSSYKPITSLMIIFFTLLLVLKVFGMQLRILGKTHRLSIEDVSMAAHVLLMQLRELGFANFYVVEDISIAAQETWISQTRELRL
ncbi:hypothetical protein ACFE04_013774 [Oxalis oulophora]